MPAPCTSVDFLALARKSGVVDVAALDAFERSLVSASPALTAKQLAAQMIQEGLLTRLQANQLLLGKWRNFFICGKYKLLEYLGSGGMGRVYLCEHSRMGRRVAIKVLPGERADDEVCLKRFQREAQAAAALDHPNIVRAHDLDTDGRLHFLVMEFVDGSSLQEIVHRFGPMSVERACHYVWQAALGLQHAHDAGLVHRDVKPANLLLDRAGLVKILDLGLARFCHAGGDDLTRQFGGRNLIGTADYLAPEQALDSHGADIRADIYSLGVTFFFLLTGRSPFKDGTIAQKLIYHRELRPQPVRSLRPEVPDGVARIIARMMAKEPKHRFQQPIDVVMALDPWTETPIPPPPEREMPHLSRAARRAEPPTTPIPRGSRPTSHSFPAPTALPRPPVRQRRTPWQAFTYGCCSAASRIAGWFGRRRPGDPRR